MKDYKVRLGSYAPRIHWVCRGTGTPKDRDEVNNLLIWWLLAVSWITMLVKRRRDCVCFPDGSQ